MQDDDERLRQAVRAGNIGIFDHDHPAGVIFWSEELRQMYGWEPDEPVAIPKIVSHVHPEDLPLVLATLQRAHDPDGDGAFDIEHRIVDRQGRVRWMLTRSLTLFGAVEGKRVPVRTIGAVQDVTHRRLAEERLRVLDTVLRSSAQAIAIADPQGTLTFANAALHRLWGHTDQESLVGRSLFSLWIIDETPAQALARIRDQRLQQVETQAVRVDGSRFDLGLTAEAVRDASGELAQVLVTFSDITGRKRLEVQLAQAQKMESVGRLAGGIAHDFNNVLTVISAGLDLSLGSLAGDHPSRAYLSDVAEAAQSATALTRHLLAFSRKEIIAPRVLDANQLIRRAEKTILRLLGEDIELEIVCAQRLAPICVDPAQLEQIVINLAVNARDAMPEGGRLTVETRDVHFDEGEAARHLDLRPGSYVLLAISDTGSGMTEEVRAHIFEPFFTTKGPGQGTGLGLPMVYGAVQQNGGRIDVSSEVGRGTTFKIYLPAAKGAPEPLAARPVRAVGAPGVPILLVEDDPRVRRVAEHALASLGHQVHSFGAPREALRAVASLNPRPRLLITDVIMPGMNGRVLAEQVAALLPDIRVLFVSGYTEGFIVDRGVLNSGIQFLAKPYSVQQLARRVREVLDAT